MVYLSVCLSVRPSVCPSVIHLGWSTHASRATRAQALNSVSQSLTKLFVMVVTFDTGFFDCEHTELLPLHSLEKDWQELECDKKTQQMLGRSYSICWEKHLGKSRKGKNMVCSTFKIKYIKSGISSSPPLCCLIPFSQMPSHAAVL